jgi:hypothetical protein
MMYFSENSSGGNFRTSFKLEPAKLQNPFDKADEGIIQTLLLVLGRVYCLLFMSFPMQRHSHSYFYKIWLVFIPRPEKSLAHKPGASRL